MKLQAFIKELKKYPGLETLAPNPEGVYSLRINHQYLVFFSSSFDDKDIYIYSPIRNTPAEEREKLEIFEHLLNANLFGQGTAHSWFACDPNSHKILLINRINTEFLNLDSFIKELQTFVGIMKVWEEKFSEIIKNIYHKKLPNTYIQKQPEWFLKA